MIAEYVVLDVKCHPVYRMPQGSIKTTVYLSMLSKPRRDLVAWGTSDTIEYHPNRRNETEADLQQASARLQQIKEAFAT